MVEIRTVRKLRALTWAVHRDVALGVSVATKCVPKLWLATVAVEARDSHLPHVIV